MKPAAFRRLCVETGDNPEMLINILPAAFRRLCVETISAIRACLPSYASRLQAAVC